MLNLCSCSQAEVLAKIEADLNKQEMQAVEEAKTKDSKTEL